MNKLGTKYYTLTLIITFILSSYTTKATFKVGGKTMNKPFAGFEVHNLLKKEKFPKSTGIACKICMETSNKALILFSLSNFWTLFQNSMCRKKQSFKSLHQSLQCGFENIQTIQ